MNWWGYHREHGWVVLDRSIERNRPGLPSDRLVFVRCRDSVAFEAARSTWNPPEFVYEPNFLKTLTPADRMIAFAELRGFKDRINEYHRAAEQYIAVAALLARIERIELQRERVAERARVRSQQAERQAEQQALAEAAQRRLLEEERHKRELHFDSLRSRLLGRQRAEADRIRQGLLSTPK